MLKMKLCWVVQSLEEPRLSLKSTRQNSAPSHLSRRLQGCQIAQTKLNVIVLTGKDSLVISPLYSHCSDEEFKNITVYKVISNRKVEDYVYLATKSGNVA